MKKPLRNLLDLSVYKQTSTPDSDPIVNEASAALRYFLEWQYLGRPEERSDWFRGGINVVQPAKDLIDEDALWTCSLDEDELDEIIEDLRVSFINKTGNYQWIPYIWKGMPDHPVVEKTLTEHVKHHWRENEPMALSCLYTLFTEAANCRLLDTYKDMMAEASLDDLRGTASNKLKVYLEIHAQ